MSYNLISPERFTEQNKKIRQGISKGLHAYNEGKGTKNAMPIFKHGLKSYASMITARNLIK